MTTDAARAPNRLHLPERGASLDEIRAALAERRRDDVEPHGARNFRPSYWIGEEHHALIEEMVSGALEQNALYAGSSFPSVRRIEAELVEMGLDLFRAPVDAAGSVTTGGSESNFLAVKTARDFFAGRRPAGAPPEIVLAHTAHPSFEKAAQLLGLATRRAPGSVDFGADVAAMAGLVNARTIMMVGSAPPAAYGQVDPIGELAALAARHGLWFHVDACMGGFFLPFARELGEAVPEFDFAVPGVWSLSADLHKFGFAPKGASLLLLADRAHLEFQHYRFDNWPWAQYQTSGFAGSRAAGPVIAAWAVMRRLGRAGYRDAIGRILAVRRRLIDGIRSIEGLRVVGRPACAHFFVAADGLDVFAVEETLAARGWALSRAYQPDSFQIWPGVAHEEIVETFLAELAAAAAETRASGRAARSREAAYAR